MYVAAMNTAAGGMREQTVQGDKKPVPYHTLTLRRASEYGLFLSFLPNARPLAKDPCAMFSVAGVEGGGAVHQRRIPVTHGRCASEQCAPL